MKRAFFIIAALLAAALLIGSVNTSVEARRRPRPTPSPTPTVTVSPTPTVTPTPTITPTVTPTLGVSLLNFGAKGDGVTDDSVAIQNALNSGGALLVPSGYTFVHSRVVSANVPISITGTGTLLATNESASAFFINSDNVTVDGPTFKMGTTTKRWDAYEQMKVRVGKRSGVTLRNIIVDGSAAAGVFVGGATNFVLDNVTVQNTRADAIHMTEGASYGQVISPTVRNAGDDGVAVVSYMGSGLDHDITITSPKFYGQTWGRAFSVVGGDRITYNNIYAENSAGATVYVASEPSYTTYGSSNVTFNGGTIVNANKNSSIVHGAVLIYNGQAAQTVNNVIVKNLTITNTNQNVFGDIRIVSDNTTTCLMSRLSISGIVASGGPPSLYQGNALGSWYNLTSSTKNGATVADHLGW